jgi:hypothetical protein
MEQAFADGQGECRHSLQPSSSVTAAGLVGQGLGGG